MYTLSAHFGESRGNHVFGSEAEAKKIVGGAGKEGVSDLVAAWNANRHDHPHRIGAEMQSRGAQRVWNVGR